MTGAGEGQIGNGMFFQPDARRLAIQHAVMAGQDEEDLGHWVSSVAWDVQIMPSPVIFWKFILPMSDIYMTL
ncbi:hypothetical protein GCM10011317_39770 [Niveispirillum cyanobacteriorum]|nr:hypothetical protein GCM10011317_39770 [Niveispirillum cyanobacteriorum]